MTITQESDAILWQNLYNQYMTESRPTHVVRGSVSYLAVQTTEGELEFRTVESTDLIGSTSLGA
jgi:hypothetical protein